MLIQAQYACAIPTFIDALFLYYSTVRVLNFVVYKFHGFHGILLSTKIYTPQKLIPSILHNYCTYYATMATKINTPRIFLPTNNMEILPTKFNTRTVYNFNKAFCY